MGVPAGAREEGSFYLRRLVCWSGRLTKAGLSLSFLSSSARPERTCLLMRYAMRIGQAECASSQREAGQRVGAEPSITPRAMSSICQIPEVSCPARRLWA